MTGTISVKDWEECGAKIREIEDQHSSIVGVWFRGHADAAWKLETTLERHGLHSYAVADYYRLIRIQQRPIESLVGGSWSVPSYETIERWTSGYDEMSRMFLTGKTELGFDFLSYLRHYGFPSPLLDWTHSSYVAAYFAFAQAQRSDKVAIFVFAEQPENMKVAGSGEPIIYTVGQNLRTDRRHFQQQSSYTICVQHDQKSGWSFVPHQKVFDLNRARQDLLWKIEIPSRERKKVLRFLDRFNLNAYSLFGTDESLMETLAIRGIDLKR